MEYVRPRITKNDGMTARQQTRGHPMFSYLILVGVASRLVNEFRILTHLLAISSYALCLRTHPLPSFNHHTTTPLRPPPLLFAIARAWKGKRRNTVSNTALSPILRTIMKTKCLCTSHIAFHPSVKPLSTVYSGVRGSFTSLQDQDE